MSIFEWKEEYRIDSGLIDREHQYLFKLAEQALAFVDPAEESEEIETACHEVYRYMQYHFENEQKLMNKAGFPGYDDHVKKHKKIIREMNTILKTSRDIRILAAELRKLMVSWVTDHIMEEDKKFSAHIKSQIGVS